MQNKLIVTAVGTFGLGALVSWAITADIYEKRFKEERAGYDQLLGDKTDHIWALQDHIERQWAQGNETTSSNSELTSISPDQTELIDINVWGSDDPIETIESPYEDAPVLEEEDVIPEGETPEETRTNLQKLIDTYTADQDAQQDFARMASQSIENDKTPPFVISKGKYAWDDEGDSFAKITLTYFPRDRVLLDDEEDPIEDVAGLVGWRSLSQFGGESDDPDVVFVRNRRLETDFEIIKEEYIQLPLHVKYGMEKEEFRANRAAGLIKLRQEDDDH